MNSTLNLITRREFVSRNTKIGLAAAFAALTDVPFVVKRALADGNIGHGKKLLFIFLRGGNDALNTIVPIQDSAYAGSRPTLQIPKDPGQAYDAKRAALFPESGPADGVFNYGFGLPLGNGFAALHPSLKFLAPVYNAGDLAIIHRVAYPRQSRSHFDSQIYWETGMPNNNVLKEGILYRAMVESGLAHVNPLTGVSVQSSLPMILRGSKAAMTNLSDPTRYNLYGIPNDSQGNAKFDAALSSANTAKFADKADREFLELQYGNLARTLSIFAQLKFDSAGNTYRDDVATDGDTEWATANNGGYWLFPDSNDRNGGWRRAGGNRGDKYVVSADDYAFFENLKAASLILNSTDAIVAGTQLDGFDTHTTQGTLTGSHPALMRKIGWALYALRKFFMIYGKGGTKPMPGATCSWDDLIIVTLSEFGRTTVENSDNGTDHAEANMMLVAGGGVRGFEEAPDHTVSRSGLFGCSPTADAARDPIPWVTGGSGSMFGVESRYLKRCVDYRSVLGKLIRDHLGATQEQLNRIIPGYANESKERLKSGGTQTRDNVAVIGEPDLI